MHLPATTPTSFPLRHGRGASLGFSLTELLVVIGIIVLLLGILLVALGKVKVTADKSRSETIMQQFANACTAFQAEHGRYPGVIPEQVLAQDPKISGTENALLELMGGYRVLEPGQVADADHTAFATASTATTLAIGAYELVVDPTKIGEGPRINGKSYAPYFTPGPDALVAVGGQLAPPFGANDEPAVDIPDLVDSWGQPILYLRQLRNKGPLVGDPAPGPGIPLPQFVMGGTLPYVKSITLGELGRDQSALSLFETATLGGPGNAKHEFLRKVLQHPSLADQARGAVVLVSAGPDGIFYSQQDGPGTQSGPVTNIVDNADAAKNNPQVVDEYDDVRIFAGG